MKKCGRSILWALWLLFVPLWVQAQTGYRLAGRIINCSDSEPIAGAVILLDKGYLWAISDGEGRFEITHIERSRVEASISCLGFVEEHREIELATTSEPLLICLKESNLRIDDVVVTAQRHSEDYSSSFVVDRTTIDHAQLLNVGHISTLLPGGKSVGDQNLASGPSRIALMAGSGSELGNASFGTAIDLDGLRLSSNAATGEIKGVDLRSVGASNIESIEVVTGIPSVEYGDLSNGIVKIQTRKGHTPYLVELMVEPKTKQIALSKGFRLGKKRGTLNLNLERTRSVSNLASPYTAYDRNNLNITYSNSFLDGKQQPLHLAVSLGGNLGGYNSEADPDQFAQTYTRTRDYALRGNIKLNWLLNRSWISNLTLQATAAYSDQTTTTRTNKSSASTQPYIHTTEEGYFVGQLYDENPEAEIILSPTGYWYLNSVNQSKPIHYTLKAKGDWSRQWGAKTNRILLGAEYAGSGNLGRGLDYPDRRYAPTWRPYRFDEQPFMHTLSLFLEERFEWSFGALSKLGVTAGLRSDMTMISRSEYGTVSTLSPRISARFVAWEGRRSTVSDLVIYGGWGKSVKQPSFTVLYPTPSYSDRLAFAPGTTADGTTFYAYYTQPTTSRYNPDLKWQYAQQSEIGLEATIAGTRISITLFRNKTFNPYMSRTVYSPFSYKLTTQSHLEADCTIPSANRQYEIDRHTGVVTVVDRTGEQAPQVIGYKERRAFVGQTEYTNGTPVERRGVNWVVDFAQIRAIRTQIRIDGNYYWYKGLNQTMVASTLSASSSMANGEPYQYVGHYAGAAAVSNGSLSRQLNANMTLVTHIPKIRMIFSLRIESSLYDYHQNLSEYADGSPRGYLLASSGDHEGSSEGLYNQGKYVAVYPEYYTTWENPSERIPFAEKFLWAKEHDPALYQELARLVLKSNTSYYFDEERITAYMAANFNLTKEVGRFASITFYARNFFYHMGKVRSSQTGLSSSLFDSGYIPKFYYGLSLRLKF